MFNQIYQQLFRFSPMFYSVCMFVFMHEHVCIVNYTLLLKTHHLASRNHLLLVLYYWLLLFPLLCPFHYKSLLMLRTQGPLLFPMCIHSPRVLIHSSRH